MLIHVGCRKAASTFLQRHVFEDANGPFQRLNFDHRSLFDESYKQQHDLNLRQLLKMPQQQRGGEIGFEGKYPVISKEILAGRPKYTGPPHDIRNLRLKTCNRLADLFPNAKILIVIRKQKAAQLSTYKQYVRRGGKLSLKQFFSAKDPNDGHSLHTLFTYHELIQIYQKKFGQSNVLVLPMEKLSQDTPGFVGSILQFCNLPSWDKDWADIPATNIGLNETGLYAKRTINALIDFGRNPVVQSEVSRLPKFAHLRLAALLNRFAKVGFANVNGLLRRKTINQLEQINNGHFNASNRITQELTDLRLAQYDYDL